MIANCIFRTNAADEDGGGAWSDDGDNSTWVNVLMFENLAGGHGGAMYIVEGTDGGLTNCTFASNTADFDGDDEGRGGGVYVLEIDREIPLQTSVINCILWDNEDSNSDVEVPEAQFFVEAINDPDATLSYSDIQEDVPANVNDGGGNVHIAPDFVNPGQGDYRLQPCSPLIDAGDPNETVIPADEFDIDDDVDESEPTPALENVDRILDGDEDGTERVDMGAYELAPLPCPWDLDGDGVVGTSDLLALLAAWGTKPGGPPDFDCDGMVGTSDLLALLANWGCCGCVSLGAPESIQDCFDRYGYEDPEVLEACICAVEPCEEGCPPDPTCK